MNTVICAFDEREQAEKAVDRLVREGFDRDHVHVEARESRAVGGSGAAPATDEDHGIVHRIERFFAELFGEDDTRSEANRYTEAWRRGGSMVIVDVDDDAEAQRARAALEQAGGTMDLDERASQWRAEGWSDDQTWAPGRGADTADSRRAVDGSAAGETVVPVVREELKVGKRDVQRGGVRVIRRITEQPIKELVRLREERAVVERRPADRAAEKADLDNLREGAIEVRETGEEPVVSKAARVVEEVVVGKRVEERDQAVEDTVRKADVEVEPLTGERASGVDARDQTGTRTRIRGATEDAAEATESALRRAGHRTAEAARDVQDDVTGKKS